MHSAQAVGFVFILEYRIVEGKNDKNSQRLTASQSLCKSLVEHFVPCLWITEWNEHWALSTQRLFGNSFEISLNQMLAPKGILNAKWKLEPKKIKFAGIDYYFVDSVRRGPDMNGPCLFFSIGVMFVSLHLNGSATLTSASFETCTIDDFLHFAFVWVITF